MHFDDRSQQASSPNRRIAALDIARGVALVAMAIYHFTWDLEFFGYADSGLTAFGGWKLFARCIASSFLFLVGVSLYFAHGQGIRWPGYWRRFAMVAGAALAISLVTFIATPDEFIFFGILHEIALASLLGLAFLRLPAVVSLIVAVGVIAAPFYLRSELFDHAFWWWLGLSSRNPTSSDYVPLFPWFAPVLLGIASAKFATAAGLASRLAAIGFGAWSRPLAFAGRHSLAFYLIHQPLLIACVWLFSQFSPAEVQSLEVRFRNACEASCQEVRDAEFCTRYCVCMLDELEKQDMLDKLSTGGEDPALRTRTEEMAGQCTIRTDSMSLEEPTP